MTDKRKYDSTIARMAGNIAGGFMDRVLVVRAGNRVGFAEESIAHVAVVSVAIARAIVAEVERTEILKENGTLPPYTTPPPALEPPPT